MRIHKHILQLGQHFRLLTVMKELEFHVQTVVQKLDQMKFQREDQILRFVLDVLGSRKQQ